MIDLLIRSRYALTAAVVALLIGLVAWGHHVRYEQSIQSFFAEGDPAVLAYKRAASAFGNDQFIFVAYDDPELMTPGGMDRVAELAKALGPDRIDGVVRVESLDAMPLLWQIDDLFLKVNVLDERLETLPGALGRALRATRDQMFASMQVSMANFDTSESGLTVGAALRNADDAERAALRDKITAHPLFRGTVVDESGRTTAVVVRLKAPEDHDVKSSVAAIRAAADAFAAKHGLQTPAAVGPPVLLSDGFTAIELDGQRLAVVGMALIGLVTLGATRSLWWALVPLVAGWLVWTSTETILSVLDLRLSLSGGPLVAQIIVLTMPAASHLALHFRDNLRQNGDRLVAARATLKAVAVPILWCALTGAIGYGALLASNVVPVRQFGAVLAICSGTAALLTLTIAPIAMLPPFGRETRPPRASRSAAGLDRLTHIVVDRPLPVVLGTFLVVMPLAVGMVWLRYESNYIHAFKPSARVVRDYDEVERKLGGIGLVSLIVPAPKPIDGPLLDRCRTVESRVAALPPQPDGTPSVNQVLSLATVLDPDGKLSALKPASRDRILGYKLALIAASPQAELLNGFWNADEGLTRIMVRLPEGQQADAKERTFAEALAIAREAFGPTAELTGLSHLLTETTRGVMATQWSTFAWSIVGILATLTIAFRGPRLALLAILPTLLAVGMVLGLMGWIGVKLDLATALIGSVALGLSVDDTFHCLLQFRRERATRPFREALFASYAVTGPGVLLSSLAVAVGFAVLRFSEFVPFSNFGAMVGIATLGSSLGNLVLLPACLALGHRFGDRPVAEN